MSFATHAPRPNGMGARDEWGRLICAQCGRPYDEGQERH
jgi:hypothetical protein